ncbi:putative MNR2-Manganese resistance protein [Fusarium austroafricanum]|uniref:Putative MNR2-Manganese resistance protein n=1 Tax=Fusarium austroafricanum TaxID=2364996 RepID=A0A8H4KPY5_9HYPO|nr:putative MNR2-Manganese resistance protein [Fusarium austroafricanum]
MSSSRFADLAGSSNAATPTPTSNQLQAPESSNNSNASKARKRKGHRGGKKKRTRRKSFAALDDDEHDEVREATGEGFFNLPRANLSNTSIDSEALLDHRDHQPLRPRRASTTPAASGIPVSPYATSAAAGNRLRSIPAVSTEEEHPDHTPFDENAPLLGESAISGYGASEARSPRNRSRRPSIKSSTTRLGTSSSARENYDVNAPPSMPGSPTFGTADRIELSLGDVMIRDGLGASRDDSPHGMMGEIDILSDMDDNRPDMNRRVAAGAEQDVCFPVPGMSELGDDDTHSQAHEPRQYRTRRRRGQWPDLSVLEEWSHMEKEDRTEERRVKRITEPQLINGRLRPVRKGWFQTDEESPYRFTYFNEEFQSTIHSQTISELVQPGGGFRELFVPDPRVLSDDESDEDDVEPTGLPTNFHHQSLGTENSSKIHTRQPSLSTIQDHHELREGTTSPLKDPLSHVASRSESGCATPTGRKSADDSNHISQNTGNTGDFKEKIVRYGERPVWWLDVLCPTEPEMKVISKAFGIHPLTAEDIMLQEAREKVELFRHYYFVNYRSFDQDNNSDNFLEPVDMYVVVFREGVLSFHFSKTPHPANVRRRIRQLKDYLILSSDWISYAIIDDITDVFAPLIQNIEDEVDEIDDAILKLHSSADKRLNETSSKTDDAVTTSDPGTDMLRRVGDCRKRVMSLYRLLGNKADVIKGFAKRCNERWEVAPRSEIGLYLGDIQDHIVTMTANLGHYEKILARSHGNYLAQINIRMNERQEQTADVLGKLTVLGTIVLPMNIITGLWGMNVWVPGQEYEGDLTWFFWITAGLLCFGLACYMIAKRVYNIV